MHGNSTHPLSIVIKNDLCTGCGLCEAVAGREFVSMGLDNESGYYRPNIHKAPTEQANAAISFACPGLCVAHIDMPASNHPVWGPLKSVKTGRSSDPEICHLGSSGGVLTALQVYLIESGLVNFVVNVRGSTIDPLGTELGICYTRDEILVSAGSRYAPSAPLSKISELLSTGLTFAFVGKPCDVAALRRLGQLDKRIEKQIPYMFSFLCAGTPSRSGTLSILNEWGIACEHLSAFRYRGEGWPGFLTAVTTDGSKFSMEYEHSWRQHLSPTVQWRCKLCPDGTGEQADISCGDAWHLTKDSSPDFSERQGRSLIFSRTTKGEALLSRCLRDNVIKEISSPSFDELQHMQFHQSYRRRTLAARFSAVMLFGRKTPEYGFRYLLRSALRLNPLASMRAFFGTLLRLSRMK